MPRSRGIWIFIFWIGLLVGPAVAQPAPALLSHLRQGVNITGWFRFPASHDPTVLAHWMSEAAMVDLRRAGFGFVRLAVDPDVAASLAVRDVVVAAVCRLERHGLAVVVDAHPNNWHLETSAADRARLLGFWRVMGPALRLCDAGLTVPEILNEPVFPHDPEGWAMLQHRVLTGLRAALPMSTIVLTGQDWGGIAGLLALTPEADRNVVYSFHFYDPAELTSLAAYRPALDRTALARLPFPVVDRAGCAAVAAGSAADLMRYYCAMGWDRGAIERRIEAAAAWGRSHHAVLLAGEFGATNQLNPAARLAWLSTVRQSLDGRGIGWALWGYDDIMGLAVARPPVRHPILDGNVLAALGLLARR